MVPLDKIFDIEYPKTLVLSEQVLDPNGTIFISSKGTDNGIAARVADIEDRKKYKSGAITVALKGSVLSAFLQTEDFYIAHQTAVLYPKNKMSDEEKLFYCACISLNAYKYNYGRQADRTLKHLLVPSEAPDWAKKTNTILPKYSNISKAFSDTNIPLNLEEWGSFQIGDLFDVKYGVNLELNAMTLIPDGLPFVSRTSNNNGISAYVKLLHGIIPNPANTISISGGGSVLECFVQEFEYYSGRDLFYLKPKMQVNTSVLLFICTIIRLEKYRFNYGRQANKTLRLLKIRLPITKDGTPNYDFMDRYIKSLPYSSALEKNRNEIIIRPTMQKVNVKGLSDQELIEKYETGEKVDFKEATKKMLQPSTTAVKSEKQRAKR